MRKGWEYKKLGEVCDVINGYAFKSSKYTSQGTRIIRITNVQKGYVVDNDPKFYSDEDFKDLFQYSLFEGDLVMSLTGNVGRVGILQKNMLPAALNQRVACLKVKSKKMQLNYLFHLLNSNLFENAAIQSARGIAQLNMSTEWLKNYIIPLPPLSTQLAIVSELDKINELIRLKKEQLKDFDNLAQSLFYEMFGDPMENEKGWEVKKLGEIGEFKNGLNFSKDEKGHSIKFLGVSDFQNKKSIASDQLAYISLSERVQEDYLLKTGDLVFVRSNGKKELIGRSVKMYITEPTTYSGFCIRCRITDEKVDKDYIAILLKTPIIRQFMTNSGRGCNISNLNQKILNSIPTILPPLPLQRLFAQRIEQIEREKSEVQKSIQDLETLLASRMQYWFE